MLGMLAAEGRGCCGLPDLGAPVSEGDSPGICVCEFEECFDMGQSRVSYHMRKLKEAGLVREERRGSRASTPSTAKPPATSWRTPGSNCGRSVQTMNVLMVGDIVGPGACRSCAEYKPWIS